MRIVVHGRAGAVFAEGIEKEIRHEVDIRRVSDGLEGEGEREAYAAADILIGFLLGPKHPRPVNVKLFQANGAGWNGVNPDYLPEGVPVCNCHGHAEPIAEYIMAGMLLFSVPIVSSDAALRRGEWIAGPSVPGSEHGELFGGTLGILGYGQIGRELARRAKAFGMDIHVCNRSDVSSEGGVDAYYPLDGLAEMAGKVDFLAVCAPLAPETEGIVDAAVLDAMRPHAVLANVGRGPIIEEQALYDALKDKRIGGALIDTWYVYPDRDVEGSTAHPGNLPFHELDNVIMTPHMSGWTNGTTVRRRAQIADNINRLIEGEPLLNVVAHGTGKA